MDGLRSERATRSPHLLGAVALGLSLLLVISHLIDPASASDQRSPELASLIADFDRSRIELRDAHTELEAGSDRLGTERRRHEELEDWSSELDARMSEERERVGSIAVLAYVDLGSEETPRTETVALALNGVTSNLRSTGREIEELDRSLESSTRRVDRAQREHDRAESVFRLSALRAREAGSALEEQLSAHRGSTVSAPAFLAAIRAAEIAREIDPGCAISPALVLGAGRILSNHGTSRGRTLDDMGDVTPPLRTPSDVGPSTTGIDASSDSDDASKSGPFLLPAAAISEFAEDGDGDGSVDIDNIFDSAATWSKALCATGEALDQSDPLVTAISRLTGNPAQAKAVVGAGRHFSRRAELGLGEVPEDPRASLAMQLMAARDVPAAIPGGSIDDLLAWSRVRLGTPYSQCLGTDARPEDPECPAGTDRFGNGFFDCSGFVSTAFAVIGIGLPTTTDAMAVDQALMSTAVSDEFDAATVRPGDILLMDGHVAIWSGEGRIIHASGGSLTEEELPDWVRNGVFVLLRPFAAG